MSDLFQNQKFVIQYSFILEHTDNSILIRKDKHYLQNFKNKPSLFLFIEVHAGTIDAVSDSSFILRSIFKDMSQMCVTAVASDFSPDHAIGGVFDLFDVGSFEFIVEGWPATSTVVFGFGGEEGDVTNDAVIHAVFLEIIVLVWV